LGIMPKTHLSKSSVVFTFLLPWWYSCEIYQVLLFVVLEFFFDSSSNCMKILFRM
jgi:hypothetical protein